jgi:hypothetical protein
MGWSRPLGVWGVDTSDWLVDYAGQDEHLCQPRAVDVERVAERVVAERVVETVVETVVVGHQAQEADFDDRYGGAAVVVPWE